MNVSSPAGATIAGIRAVERARKRADALSLKLSLSGFRNEGHFCGALAVKIRDEVAEALDLPSDKVQVTLKQKARGGITDHGNLIARRRPDARDDEGR